MGSNKWSNMKEVRWKLKVGVRIHGAVPVLGINRVRTECGIGGSSNSSSNSASNSGSDGVAVNVSIDGFLYN